MWPGDSGGCEAAAIYLERYRRGDGVVVLVVGRFEADAELYVPGGVKHRSRRGRIDEAARQGVAAEGDGSVQLGAAQSGADTDRRGRVPDDDGFGFVVVVTGE